MKITLPLLILTLLICCSFDMAVVDAGYSSSQSVQNLFTAYAAYCGSSSLLSWTCTWCGNFSARNPNFKVFRVVSNSTYDNFGFVGYDTRNNYIYVTFRGTVGDNDKNWLEDLKLTKTSGYFGSGIAVHTGFLQGYLSLKQQTLSALNVLLTLRPTATIIATGHSLGGALATVFAADFANINSAVPIQVWTYGSPRVGNSAFVSYFRKLSSIQANWRVVNNRDVVPHIPFEIAGFRHVTTEVWYRDATRFQICSSTNGEDPNCSDSIAIPNVSDHLNYFGYQEGCRRDN